MVGILIALLVFVMWAIARFAQKADLNIFTFLIGSAAILIPVLAFLS